MDANLRYWDDDHASGVIWRMLQCTVADFSVQSKPFRSNITANEPQKGKAFHHLQLCSVLERRNNAAIELARR